MHKAGGFFFKGMEHLEMKSTAKKTSGTARRKPKKRSVKRSKPSSPTKTGTITDSEYQEILDRVCFCVIMSRELKVILDKHNTLIGSEEPYEKLSSLSQALESCRQMVIACQKKG